MPALFHDDEYDELAEEVQVLVAAGVPLDEAIREAHELVDLEGDDPYWFDRDEGCWADSL